MNKTKDIILNPESNQGKSSLKELMILHFRKIKNKESPPKKSLIKIWDRCFFLFCVFAFCLVPGFSACMFCVCVFVRMPAHQLLAVVHLDAHCHLHTVTLCRTNSLNLVRGAAHQMVA